MTNLTSWQAELTTKPDVQMLGSWIAKPSFLLLWWLWWGSKPSGWSAGAFRNFRMWIFVHFDSKLLSSENFQQYICQQTFATRSRAQPLVTHKLTWLGTAVSTSLHPNKSSHKFWDSSGWQLSAISCIFVVFWFVCLTGCIHGSYSTTASYYSWSWSRLDWSEWLDFSSFSAKKSPISFNSCLAGGIHHSSLVDKTLVTLALSRATSLDLMICFPHPVKSQNSKSQKSPLTWHCASFQLSFDADCPRFSIVQWLVTRLNCTKRQGLWLLTRQLVSSVLLSNQKALGMSRPLSLSHIAIAATAGLCWNPTVGLRFDMFFWCWLDLCPILFWNIQTYDGLGTQGCSSTFCGYSQRERGGSWVPPPYTILLLLYQFDDLLKIPFPIPCFAPFFLMTCDLNDLNTKCYAIPQRMN